MDLTLGDPLGGLIFVVVAVGFVMGMIGLCLFFSWFNDWRYKREVEEAKRNGKDPSDVREYFW